MNTQCAWIMSFNQNEHSPLWTETYILLIKGRQYFLSACIEHFSIINARCCITLDESEPQGWCLIPLSDRSLCGSEICDQNLIQAGCAGKSYISTFHSLAVFKSEHFQGQHPSLPHLLHQTWEIRHWGISVEVKSWP